MAIATSMHLNSNEGFMSASQAIEMGVVFLGLDFVGPGTFSVDKK
jgi:putative oxidoreductase